MSQDLDDIQNEVQERQSTRNSRQAGDEGVGSTSRTIRGQNQARSMGSFSHLVIAHEAFLI